MITCKCIPRLAWQSATRGKERGRHPARSVDVVTTRQEPLPSVTITRSGGLALSSHESIDECIPATERMVPVHGTHNRNRRSGTEEG
jgi:hypothetical protein